MTLPSAAATAAVLNITAATVLRTSGAYVGMISVVSAGTAGAIFDAASAGGTAGKQIGIIPATAGYFPIGIPCSTGVFIAPGAGQNLTVTLA